MSAMMMVAMLLFSVAAQGQAQNRQSNPVDSTAVPAEPKLDEKWRFLVGEWSGEGGGEPGGSTGTCSFRFDLQQHVLVRRSHTEFPASGQRPGTIHDDLMVIYPTPQTNQARAIYFDNEGHVIEYAAEWSVDGNELKLVSQPSPTSPRFRLVYKKIDARTMSLAFEIAPPGESAAFKQHVWGRLHRSDSSGNR